MSHRRLIGIGALAALAFLRPGAAQVDLEELRPGLVATYKDSAGVEVVRLDPVIGLNWKANETAHPRLKADGSTVRWQGYINILRPGGYRFSALVRGKLKVSVAGQDVLAADAVAELPKMQQGGDVKLPAGVQPIAVEFTRPDGAARLELFWQSPYFSTEPLPYDVLFHLPKNAPAKLASDYLAERGRLIVEERNCVSCHRPDDGNAIALGLLHRPAPDLSQVGGRVHAGWLHHWLADPQAVRPGAQMPKMFSDQETAELYAVSRYLQSLGDTSKPAKKVDAKGQRAAAARGEKLFAAVGCVACHQEKPAPMQSAAANFYGQRQNFPLTGLGSKTTPDKLAVYLVNPLAIDPSGRMPNMLLDAKEATDLAYHLCESTDAKIKDALPAAPADSQRLAAFKKLKPKADELAAFDKLVAADQWTNLGQRLVVARGCTNCHNITSGSQPLDKQPASTSLPAIRAGKGGCISDTGTAPHFGLSAADQQAVQAFLKYGLEGAGTSSPTHAARQALIRFNCLACHGRDGEGGLAPDLVEHLRQFEKTENAETVTPPPLTGVGHRLRTPWLKEVLTNRGRARPWMGLRMPQFGPEQVETLPDALAWLEGAAADDTIHDVKLNAAKIAAGRELVGKSAFGCISCHDIAGIPNFGTRGPDLALMNQRVRYDWYVRWLSEAQRMQPGTRMPTVFPEGRSLYDKLLNGQSLPQAEAMWAYLSLGNGLPLPEGLEPPKGLILSVQDKPYILRTFMPEAGSRALAIGYPDGVSLAYDAATGRAAFAWSGNFIDATPVWANRGGSPAKILGPRFWTSPAGTPWAAGGADAPPDFAAIAKDPAWGGPLGDNQIFNGTKQYQFLGYGVDSAGLPTFRYRIHAGDPKPIEVSERPAPLRAPVAAGLRRQFTLNLPGGQTPWLHAGETTSTPRILDSKANPQAFDAKAEQVEVPIADRLIALPGQSLNVLSVTAAPAGSRWLLRKQGNAWQVYLQLPDKAGEARVDLNIWSPYKDEPALLKELVAK